MQITIDKYLIDTVKHALTIAIKDDWINRKRHEEALRRIEELELAQ